MIKSFMNSQGLPLNKVRSLKQWGNDLYKQSRFDNAAACYDETCKLLGFTLGVMDDYDSENLSNLAISLNLNLAACALKFQEHEAANDLCSLVLSYFPRNVKALFRRASAFMSMKLYLEAKSDLEKAMLVEPKNKDIVRELNVVKNYLVINVNGKRSMEIQSQQDEIREGKRPIHTPIFEFERTFEKDGCSSSGSILLKLNN
ncbi:hypothetical protein RND81_04G181800 [Saponaria officinalis]|uniref:Uncharacterized protein n=1 Tax=Saponaria officinalis TaxID=3572 RepID=A0AAW1LJ12_SAPOF